MTRFCPYCGKQLGERSRFCPRCGKASPKRRRTGAVVVDEGQVATALRADGGAVAVPRRGERTSTAGEAAASAPRRGSGNSAARHVPVTPSERRYAPPTHALIGAFEQAGFGLRYGAWMFDFLITLIAMMVFTFVVTAASNRSVVGSNLDLVIVAALSLLLFVLNFVAFAGATGQSAGMRILGIYIVKVDGRPFTRKDAVLRHLLGYPLSMIPLFLGFLWMLWDPRQQAWHDKLARTIVVMSR